MIPTIQLFNRRLFMTILKTVLFANPIPIKTSRVHTRAKHVTLKSSRTTVLYQTNTTTKPTAKKHQSLASHQVSTDPKVDKNAVNALLEIIATALQNLLVVLVTTALVMVHDKPARQGPLVTVKEKKKIKPV